MVGIITVIGTSLALFLIMVVVMMQEIQIAPFAPESNRERLLHGMNVHVTDTSATDDMGGGSSSAMSYNYARRLYDDLPCVEHVSYTGAGIDRIDAQEYGGRPFSFDVKYVDDEFWKVFDHTFLYGHPFDRAAFESALKEVVITESVARKVFGAVDVVGRDLLVGMARYKVVGVVEDVSTLASNAYGQLFIPFTIMGYDRPARTPHDCFGFIRAYLLVDDKANFDKVKTEVKRRVDVLSSEMAIRDGKKIVYHEAPYDQETSMVQMGSNTTPDIKGEHKIRLAVYIILLLIPAINLSSMTHSRLRRRVAEIGVRRAFGCTRKRVIIDIVSENFLITLVGGFIGMVLSVAYAFLFTNMFQSVPMEGGNVAVTLPMVLHVSTFAWALLFCFMLNLLSSGIPAWRASRISPVEALGGINK